MEKEKIKGRPMVLDEEAKSSTKEPAFLTPPKGAKVYHGFPLIKEVNKDGFTFGAITEFLGYDKGCSDGDAFVEAPDGSRAGIAWETGKKFETQRVGKNESSRWGVYYFMIPFKIRSMEDMQKAFEMMLPELKSQHKKWKKELAKK
ncbi:MAG: 3-deoxy-8-phosphooctulonate synthase [Nanoarchaeota archaeon]|nr:3-deoxy-8-phosphooctulonate synthase [Nanoarchaeota archaeon]MBU1103162.1 3-deoxy-8-phosphooctulonate synthase [Nanoarchaeota archaeon]